MDLTGLRALCAAADAGSLTAAARQLGLTQPGLSRRIQRLEDELGARLLERAGRGVRLTPAGQRFREFATRTLAAYEAVRTELASGQTPLSGVIRIIASTTPGEYLVPALASRFTEMNPEVSCQVAVADSAAVADELVEGRADVGFSGHRSGDGRLTEVAVARDEIVLAVPAGHRLARFRSVPAEALDGERLIQREEGSGTQSTFLEALAEHAVELPVRSPTVRLGSTQAVLSAVDAGMGIGLVTQWALDHHRPARVTPLRIAGVPVFRDLFVVHETARQRPAHVEAFLAFVSAGVGGPVP